MISQEAFRLHRGEVVVDRPSTEETLMRCADAFAERSTCKRLKVGAVVTDLEMSQIVGFGYNGNARKLPNTCDSDEPGACGCFHAEMNALLKAPGALRDKRLFTTTAPCTVCAKGVLNSNVSVVYFRRLYRSSNGLRTLLERGVRVEMLFAGGASTLLVTPDGLDALERHD